MNKLEVGSQKSGEGRWNNDGLWIKVYEL